MALRTTTTTKKNTSKTRQTIGFTSECQCLTSEVVRVPESLTGKHLRKILGERLAAKAGARVSLQKPDTKTCGQKGVL